MYHLCLARRRVCVRAEKKKKKSVSVLGVHPRPLNGATFVCPGVRFPEMNRPTANWFVLLEQSNGDDYCRKQLILYYCTTFVVKTQRGRQQKRSTSLRLDICCLPRSIVNDYLHMCHHEYTPPPPPRTSFFLTSSRGFAPAAHRSPSALKQCTCPQTPARRWC